MDWNRVKSIFIYILIAINIGLLALNYKEGQKYTCLLYTSHLLTVL